MLNKSTIKNILNAISSFLGWWKDNGVGVIMTDTNAVAQESYDYWKTLTRLPFHTFALLGNEEGETSFSYKAVGDKKTGGAHGIFQWHQARIDTIKKGCGIDILTCSHLDQLKAAYWEMNHGNEYRHVWEHLMATETLEDAVKVLIREEERSGSQDTDFVKRLAYAKKWQAKWDTPAKLTEQEPEKEGEEHKLTLRISPVAYTQEEFKAFVDKLDLSKLQWHPKFITLHNTATPSLKQWSAYGPAQQKRWPSNLNQYYSNLGWHSSVHLVICPDYIWNLCNLLQDGVHASCFNHVSFGIEQVGDFSTEDYNSGLGLKVQENAIYTLAVLCNKFNWNPADFELGVKGLHFHKECHQDHHDCPGKNVVKADVIKKITAKMAELKKKV